MNTPMTPYAKVRNALMAVAFFCTVLTLALPPAGSATESAGSRSSGSPKVGDSYGGGIVAYLLKPGDNGYVAGQPHGLIAAREDQSTGATWKQAARICRTYRGGGFRDWTLPNRHQLDRLYVNRNTIGGFSRRGYYWSSTASDLNDAWDQSFRTGERTLGFKMDYNLVRAVRHF